MQMSMFAPISITLTRGYVTLVDPIDADLAELNWGAVTDNDENTYVVRYVPKSGGKRERLHRVILSRMLNRDLLRSYRFESFK